MAITERRMNQLKQELDIDCKEIEKKADSILKDLGESGFTLEQATRISKMLGYRLRDAHRHSPDTKLADIITNQV